MAVKEGAIEEIERQKPVIERKREWTHGSEGLGDKCSRSNKPVYTDPEKVPGTCRDWYCDNTEYYGGKVVIRDKNSKKILHREGE